MVTQMAILTLFNGFGITVLMVMCTFISLHGNGEEKINNSFATAW